MRRIVRIAGVGLGVVLVVSLILIAALYRADIPVAELKPKYFTPESKFVVVRGDSLHVRLRGQGPPIFLLHGSFASLHTWNDWEDSLSLRFRTISLDFPGHGLSGPSPRKHYSTDDYATSVLALADALEIDTFSVAGNSMGGAVAYKLAIRSGRVNKLILVDAAGAPAAAAAPGTATAQPQQRPWIFGWLSNPLTARLMTRLTPRFLFEKVMGGVFADQQKITPAMIDRYYELMLREGNRTATLERLQTPQTDSRDSLSMIHIPTLILWGEQDSWIPASHANRFAKAIPNSEVVIFPHVGHVPMEEVPVESFAVVLPFLQQPPAQSEK